MNLLKNRGKKEPPPEPEPVDLEVLGGETVADILKTIKYICERIQSEETTAKDAKRAADAIARLTEAACAIYATAEGDDEEDDDEEGEQP